MEAIVVHEYGGPEVLKSKNIRILSPETGEVLVRVAAASVNPADYKQRSGAMKDVFFINFPGVGASSIVFRAPMVAMERFQDPR
jgi:NADPH:quinone reductase-like Zn-dependent oxidoreductase